MRMDKNDVSYFQIKSLIETCPYIIIRRRHHLQTGELNPSSTPIGSPVFDSLHQNLPDPPYLFVILINDFLKSLLLGFKDLCRN